LKSHAFDHLVGACASSIGESRPERITRNPEISPLRHEESPGQERPDPAWCEGGRAPVRPPGFRFQARPDALALGWSLATVTWSSRFQAGWRPRGRSTCAPAWRWRVSHAARPAAPGARVSHAQKVSAVKQFVSEFQCRGADEASPQN